MKVSAIIPCHNNARWITAALDSVAAQSLPVDDVIVLVDASSDDSAALAAAHPLRPRVELTQFRNAGAARNRGAELARHPWIAFLDADDWWIPDHLRLAARLLEGTRDVAYFGHFVEHWGDAGLYHHRPALSEPGAGLSGADFYRAFLGPNPGWPTSGMILSRDRFLEVGGFDVSQVRRHDTELFSRVLHGHTWSYNPREVFFYRKAVGESISTDRAACSYYRLRADVRIVQAFGPAQGRAHLRKKAEEALSLTLSERRRDLFAASLTLGRPYLSGARRWFYSAARWAPGAMRPCLALGRLWRQRGRSAAAPPPVLPPAASSSSESLASSSRAR